MTLYNITNAVKKLQEDGFKTWSDENHIVRNLDSFATIFYAKYGGVVNDFTFWIKTKRTHVYSTGKRTFLCVENVSGFGYRFPVSK